MTWGWSPSFTFSRGQQIPKYHDWRRLCPMKMKVKMCVFVLMLLQPTTCYDWLCVRASKHAQYIVFSEIHACVHLFAIIANVALYILTMPYMASCNNRHISFLHLLSPKKADKILCSSTTHLYFKCVYACETFSACTWELESWLLGVSHTHKASEPECARWKVGNQQRDEHAEKVKKWEMERWIT